MAEKVTLAEAKALGFNSTKGITKEGGMYKFSESLAPERGGFQSVAVAAPGQLQMTPYYGDVTGSYRLTQEQYAAATSGGKVDTAAQARAMQENEIKALVAGGMSLEDATKKVSSEYGIYGIGGTGGTTGGGAGGALGSSSVTAASTEAQRAAKSAYDILLSEFNQYGLGSLVEPLKALIVSGPSAAELTLALRATEAYQKRFAANAERIRKGLTALNEATYIGLEDKYQSVMRNYGLPASYYSKDSMGRQAGFEKLIANDVSATELEERVLTAQNRVLNAPAEVTTALKKFYPDITNGDILAYTLDPEKGLSEIKRKVTAAEIGGAALSQGLETGLARAEELAGYGVTAATARQGYQAAAPMIQRGRQLADFYQESPYTQATAEEELFGLAGAAEAGAKRKKLTSLEQASFAGRSGLTGGALSRERAGQY